MTADRVGWVDYAKGFCIVMVVAMHTTLGVEKAAEANGWMHEVIAFAQPFRMPDFFLISGLFLARVIDRDWRTYLDRKVVHFAYFYILWVAINFAVKGPGMVAEEGIGGLGREIALSLIDPFGTMWFIYMLPIFFVLTKLLRAVPPLLVLAVAAMLQILPIQTGWMVPDEFAERFVFFYAGYVFAPYIFSLAAWAIERSGAAVLYLCTWALVNGTLVALGWSMLPGVSLVLGAAGAVAVVAFAALLSKGETKVTAPLRYAGRHSLVVYLAFFLFMAAGRAVFLRFYPALDLGTISLLITVGGVVGPLLLHLAVKRTPLRYLFERPHWARLEPRPARLAPAE